MGFTHWPTSRLIAPLLALFLFFCQPFPLLAKSKPHILFISVDDLRPQINAYGHEEMITPNIDALASKGVVFDRAFANYPVCGASRASVMTGMRPTPERFTSYKTSAMEDAPDAVALNTWFKKHGYVTAGNGKIFHHNRDHKRGWSYNYRPREFMQYNPKRVSKYQGVYGATGVLRGKPPRKWAWQAQDVSDEELQGGQIAARVEQQIVRAAEDNNPWFITMGLTKPHLPFISPTRYWDMYEHAEIEVADNPFAPSGVPRGALHNSQELRNWYDLIPESGPIGDHISRYLVHGYYAAVTYSDAMIGRALQALEREGIADRTIVVLWGDHGYQLGEHGLWNKHTTFHTSLQVPLVIYAPGVTVAGERSAAIVELVDLFPTLCDLAGVPYPEDQLEGDSFVEILARPELVGKSAGFARYGDAEAIVTATGIYTRFGDGDRMYYDHTTDPQENVNVAHEAAYADTVNKLDAILSAHVNNYAP